MSTCPNCGAETLNNNKICERCGASLDVPVGNTSSPNAGVGEENPYAFGTQSATSRVSPTSDVDCPAVPKSMTEAVRICFKKYRSAQGRASRAEYWYFVLFSFLVLIALVLVGISLVTIVSLFGLATFGILVLVYFLIMFEPGVNVTIRRLHDSAHSGWALFVVFVPYIGSNGYYFIVENNEWFINVVPFIGVPVFLIFTLLAGTDGPNKYGSKPGSRD